MAAPRAKPRGILIAGNWKMNHGPAEAARFFSGLSGSGAGGHGQGMREMNEALIQGRLRARLYPPAVSLESTARAAGAFRDFPVLIGAQNAHGELSGAFTGEISGPMPAELKIRCALVGHSERRIKFGENDALILARLEGLLSQGFEVILCVGETREERESGKTQAILDRQLKSALSPKSLEHARGQLVIAYEPVWAIGTGLNATREQAAEAHSFIRGILAREGGSETAALTPILYGGSVTPENIASLLAPPEIDGCLVGGASLKPEGFIKLLAAGFAALG